MTAPRRPTCQNCGSDDLLPGSFWSTCSNCGEQVRVIAELPRELEKRLTCPDAPANDPDAPEAA